VLAIGAVVEELIEHLEVVSMLAANFETGVPRIVFD
jgi:hypothetical protein